MQEGIDAELTEFTNSADGLSALRAGKLDVGAFGTTAPLVHISKGAELEIIGGIMGEDVAIITTAENASKIQKIEDLKGKKVATVRLASGDAVLRGALDAKNISWKTDLSIFELKNPPAVIEAVKSNQVDVGVVWGPHDNTAEAQGLKIVLRSKDLSPGHPCCRITVQKQSLSNQDLWVRFIRAILKAEKYTKDNKTETLDIIAKYIKLDKSILEKSFYSPYLDQSTDPNLKGVTTFWKTMQADSFVVSNLNIKDFVDVTLYKKALDGLIKEDSKEAYWKKLEKEYTVKDL
jgi:NitT/TauT family transport system substrate-binding protein